MTEAINQPSNPLTPAAFYILLALATRDRHGYDIMKQAAHDSSGRVNLGPGTLYGTVKLLLASGAIEESDSRPDPELDDQRRRYYHITEAGRRQLGLELKRLDHTLTIARQYHLLPDHKLQMIAGHV